MKKIFLTGLLVFVLTILFSSTALAQVKTKSVIKLPTFMSGDVQLIDKAVDGDLMIAGKEVKITSDINGDAYVGGGQVEIKGNINGNLIVAGGTVKISGKVLKNLIMAGGQVVVDDSAKIGGYVLAGGRKIDLLGNFSGPVKIGAESLVIGEKVVINGNLEANVSKSEVSSTAKITGEKNIKIYEVKKTETRKTQANQLKQFAYVGKTVSFLGELLILLILIKLFGQKIKKINLKDSLWSNIGLGLVVLIVVPILTLILMVTVVAIPLSVIIFVTYLIVLYLSEMVVSILAGNFMAEKGYLKINNYYLRGGVGLLLLTLVGLIPFVGGLVKFIVLLLGVGVIFRSLRVYFSKK